MHEAALPLLDGLAEPIAVLRNPAPDDPRPVHVLTERQLAQLRPEFAAAGIDIELVDNDSGRVRERVALASARAGG
jgi:hypothetical protein